jgi:hypothetical protein
MDQMPHPEKKFNQIYLWLSREFLWALLDAIQWLNCIFLLKLFKISRQGMSREKNLKVVTTNETFTQPKMRNFL